MFKTKEYDYTGGVLTPTEIFVPHLRDITLALERANGDENNALFLGIMSRYVAFDPKNRTIEQWLDAGQPAELEATHPWLRYYVGDGSAPLPPPHDSLARQNEANEEVDRFRRRKFKAERARTLAKSVVDIGGKPFDADEESQTRMARAITIAQMLMLNSLEDSLTTAAANPVLSAAELADTLAAAIANVKAANPIQWMLADNTGTVSNATELTAALHAAMLAQEAIWGFEGT